MIWRSMPFYLLTCSITRFRSGCMPPPGSSRVRVRRRRPGEVVFDVGALDGGERNHRARAALLVHGDPLGRDLRQRAAELTATAERLARADAHALSEGTLE